jgi:hypothetical protein
MSRKRTPAKLARVQMRLEPLDGRVLPDAKVDLDLGGPVSVQPADVPAKPNADNAKNNQNPNSVSADAGAILTAVLENFKASAANNPAYYQAMLHFIDGDGAGAIAHQFVALEKSSENVSATKVAEVTNRLENSYQSYLRKADEASVVLVEIAPPRETESDKSVAGGAASASATSAALAQAATELKSAPTDPRHGTNELNAAALSAASEFHSNSAGRLDGDRAPLLLTPNRVESTPAMLMLTKDPLVVPPSYASLTPIAPTENAVVPPTNPSVVSVADMQVTEPASQPTPAEETPAFSSQAADLIARYTPFDSATVNENIERFLNSLRESRLPRSSGWNVWKVAAFSTAGAASVLGAEFVRRKRLLARVPVIRNLSQRLTRTKMA